MTGMDEDHKISCQDCMTLLIRGKCPDEQCKADHDAMVLGQSFMKDGKRIDPRDVYILPDNILPSIKKLLYRIKFSPVHNEHGRVEYALARVKKENLVQMERELEKFIENAAKPIPMFLTCPSCMEQHIDRDEWATRLHKTHLCETCGHEWRPANIPTIGVTKL